MLSEFTLDTLRGLSKNIFLNATQIFLNLNSGIALRGADGLSGTSLDKAIIQFEQGIVARNFIDRRLPPGSLTRTFVNNEINDLADGIGILGFGGINNNSLRRASIQADVRGFNFINTDDRIQFGFDLLDLLNE